MSYTELDIDLSPIVDELKLHRPMFPANGWKVLLGRTNKDGKHHIEELPVMGLVWNAAGDKYAASGCVDFIVWYSGRACYLSAIEDSKFCTVYERVVTPTDDLEYEKLVLRNEMEEYKEEDIKRLQGE